MLPSFSNVDLATTTQCGLASFFAVVGAIMLRHAWTLFLDSHGWRHRLAGAFHFAWLASGLFLPDPSLLYDLALGCSGVLTTLTAARDFPHVYVQNAPGQSGTLSQKAMVTQAEMQEHAFYQGLNLAQSIYMHAVMHVEGFYLRWLCLLAVTLPWYWRHRFPVHSFRDNWNKHQPETELEALLYRIKKWQYVFYKHVVFHGLNISMALSPIQLKYRLFWICLNTSYVMEFFLQSLVKRRILSQATMLLLNQFLMVVSSVSSIPVLLHVSVPVSLASLVLNFVNRHHDVGNTMGVATLALLLSVSFGQGQRL